MNRVHRAILIDSAPALIKIQGKARNLSVLKGFGFRTKDLMVWGLGCGAIPIDSAAALLKISEICQF